MSPRPPRVPVYKDQGKMPGKPGPAQAKKPMDPEKAKKMQKVLEKLHRKAIEVEKLVNSGRYKDAYKLAMSGLKKYTVGTIRSQDLLGRMAAMANTALEYLDAMQPRDDEAFLEFLGRELENYKDLDVFRTIEQILASRVEAWAKDMVESGRERWVLPWLDTWSPWIKLVDAEKQLQRLADGKNPDLKWKYVIPVEFAPGEKQDCLEKRQSINKALRDGDKTLAEVEEETADREVETAVPAIPSEPPIPVIKRASSASTAGIFSSKKQATSKPATEETQKAPKRKRQQARATERKPEDDRLRASEVKDYLVRLKYEENVNEVHYQKIKVDLGIVSVNKARKLFKILQRYEEKGLILRKRGSIYAILA